MRNLHLSYDLILHTEKKHSQFFHQCFWETCVCHIINKPNMKKIEIPEYLLKNSIKMGCYTRDKFVCPKTEMLHAGQLSSKERNV